MDKKMNGESEKLGLEHEAAKIFMHAYETLTGKAIRHIWHNKPRKPDTSCMLDGEHLDLEIAHLYGSELEAMKFLGRELSGQSKLDLHLMESSTDSSDRLLIALNSILEKKSHKYYRSHRAWLVIRNVHTDWDVEKIKKLFPDIIIPKSHPFNQIWVIGDVKRESGIVCLYQ